MNTLLGSSTQSSQLDRFHKPMVFSGSMVCYQEHQNTDKQLNPIACDTQSISKNVKLWKKMYILELIRHSNYVNNYLLSLLISKIKSLDKRLVAN